MTVIWAETALTRDGWCHNVRIEINANGQIQSVQSNHPGDRPNNQPGDEQRVGILVPAPANSHSHGFQRAMAGLTEQRGPDPADSFWTWRKLMYSFLEQITPDQAEAIAALVQMEMLEAGFATNVEFHYLHHQADGQPYNNIAEMSARIAAATATTGIGLTLLPVAYQYGGCDKRPLGPGQIRFGNDPGRFADLVIEARKAVAQLPLDCLVGTAPHSLRAVAPEDLAAYAELAATGPVHMHIAEQVAEVDEVLSAWGARPVEWALDNIDLGPRWCLIHCTQMLPHETQALAATGAVAGLCPLTEASLGDGIFDGIGWMDAAGKISIGSDSNIRISLAEELRMLDTGQRLRDHTRAALANREYSTGRRLFDAVCTGGAQAAGRNSGTITAGAWADLLALDENHIDLSGLTGDTILDSFIFTGDSRMVRDVWSAGRHMVRNGQHVHRDAIVSAYHKAVAPLRNGL